MSDRKWTKADQRTADMMGAGELAGLQHGWKNRVTGGKGGEPTDEQVNAYLDHQLSRTADERDAERRARYRARDQSMAGARWIVRVLAALMIAVGVWQGWWPLWLLGGFVIAIPVLTRGSNVRDSEVNREARNQYREWEEGLIEERSRVRGGGS